MEWRRERSTPGRGSGPSRGLGSHRRGWDPEAKRRVHKVGNLGAPTAGFTRFLLDLGGLIRGNCIDPGGH